MRLKWTTQNDALAEDCQWEYPSIQWDHDVAVCLIPGNVRRTWKICSSTMWQWRGDSPPQNMPRSDFNSLALGTRWASGLGQALQKYVFVPYRELAYVTCPHEWIIIVAQWGKNLNRVKNDLSFEWEWCIYVQLVWILTTIKRKSVVESGEK